MLVSLLLLCRGCGAVGGWRGCASVSGPTGTAETEKQRGVEERWDPGQLPWSIWGAPVGLRASLQQPQVCLGSSSSQVYRPQRWERKLQRALGKHLWLRKPPDVAGWTECNPCFVLVRGGSVGLEMALVSPCHPALCSASCRSRRTVWKVPDWTAPGY